MSQFLPNLLRRTLVMLAATAAAAASALLFSVPATAQTVTLTGATGNSCSYSSLTVNPNGSVTVTCTGSSPPPPPPPPVDKATFTVSGPATLAPNTTGTILIARGTDQVAAAVAFGYSTAGAGCAFQGPVAGPVWLSSGQSQQYGVAVLASGICSVVLTVQEGHNNAGAFSITVTSGTTPPPSGPPPVAGCPAPPLNVVAGNMPLFGSVDQLRMTSGQIGYYPLMHAPDGVRASVAFTQGQQPNLPSGTVTTEFSVSRCPGVIETAPAQCYYRNIGSNNSNSITIYTRPTSYWPDEAAFYASGTEGCWAANNDSTGQPIQYYVNVRWTYPSCPWSTGCGFSMQYAIGPW